MSNNNSLSKISPILFGFFIMGFCDIVGVSVTYAKEQFNWSETQTGFLPSMVFIWFFLLSIPTAIAMHKIGRKNTVSISMLVTLVAMLVPLFSFNEITCYIAFALLGIGNTILQVSLNPLLTNVVKGNQLTSSLTAGQFIKAISSFLGPIIAGFCSIYLGSWEYIFPIFGGVTLISALWLLLTPISEAKVESKPSSFSEIWSLLKDRNILLLFIGILCIVGLDVGMNIITPKLLMERTVITKEIAGYGSSWYFAARTIGTALGVLLLIKFAEKKYFRINMLIALLAIMGLLFADTQLTILICVCVIAFCSASIFSIIYSLALQSNPNKANEISGLMITGVAGGAIFPFLMGIAADTVGSQIGSILILCLIVVYLLYCAYGLRVNK